ncbi:predicted protein [Plenodomus lingam JN3]|uniref:Predicted protein n=1 Tax=Leptosphaeria maculans (strain JN3 / isolate v23.1.3 / race Av1-4-5-6-7-8) TaxID=985895 RepID=E4ZWI5_LEPMJ|nr:predicted protein [Plenodomus lingam JN3]CBX95961.1 predicted protein [Plenodomus lingam JN3]
MAALLAVGIGLGAEKLGRKISDKRLERKEKKNIAEYEARYGVVESSSSSSAYATREKQSRVEKKQEEAQRELRAARQDVQEVPEHVSWRHSVGECRFSEEAPPPSSVFCPDIRLEYSQNGVGLPTRTSGKDRRVLNKDLEPHWVEVMRVGPCRLDLPRVSTSSVICNFSTYRRMVRPLTTNKANINPISNGPKATRYQERWDPHLPNIQVYSRKEISRCCSRAWALTTPLLPSLDVRYVTVQTLCVPPTI